MNALSNRFLSSPLRVAVPLLIGLCLLVASTRSLHAQTPRGTTPAPEDPDGLKSTAVMTIDSSLRVQVRNIDITRFPKVGIVFDVFDRNYQFIDTLTKEDIEITEDSKEQEVLSLSMITSYNRVPVDFVFVIDQTGSMGEEIDAVKQNIDDFTTRLAAKGIDYRLGLIVFDDNVPVRHWMTDDLAEFKSWIGDITASGGGDKPENALEALRAAMGLNFRSSANKVAVLVTDAPFHRYNENGYGRTRYTEETMAIILQRNDVRVFSIVDTTINGYWHISERTGGRVFNITAPFADILGNVANTMTSLYTATYRSNADIIPDSVEVELRMPSSGKVSKKSFAVLEVGRKLVLENIHFAYNRYDIKGESMPELDNLVRMMLARPTLRIKIEGHTDGKGDDHYNLKLSQLRAESVKRYMVRKGVAAERLFTIGYGAVKPTATNETEEGRRLNRRTEFIIIQK